MKEKLAELKAVVEERLSQLMQNDAPQLCAIPWPIAWKRAASAFARR